MAFDFMVEPARLMFGCQPADSGSSEILARRDCRPAAGAPGEHLPTRRAAALARLGEEVA